MDNFAVTEVKRLNDAFFAETGARRRFFCRTFGCQMNAHDSERLAGLCADMGFTPAESDKDADLVIFNTCCVRENAENKIFGNLGWLKNIKDERRRQRRDFKAVVCGCMVQRGAVVDKIRETYSHVDVIFGTFNIHKFPELLLRSYNGGGMTVDIWERREEFDEGALPQERELPFKASVNVMYGCDNFCSYCIVPYVRGREKSRDTAEILREVNAAVASGAKEILLLGQNVNSYSCGGRDFADLLSLAADSGALRVRFMTSHPKDLSPRLIAVMRERGNVCKHLHLPFQSGSTRILAAMNRKYTKEGYLGLVGRLRREIPEISITTDIIVGFPGETEADFADTLDVVRAARFNGAFTFYYSPRAGTPAAAMTGQVGAETARERFGRLTELTGAITYEINKSFEGKVFKVLAEKSEGGVISGRTDGNALVHFKAGERVVGEVVKVRIIEGKPFYLMGEIV